MSNDQLIFVLTIKFRSLLITYYSFLGIQSLLNVNDISSLLASCKELVNKLLYKKLTNCCIDV